MKKLLLIHIVALFIFGCNYKKESVISNISIKKFNDTTNIVCVNIKYIIDNKVINEKILTDTLYNSKSIESLVSDTNDVLNNDISIYLNYK